jgi:hypothetical protein
MKIKLPLILKSRKSRVFIYFISFLLTFNKLNTQISHLENTPPIIDSLVVCESEMICEAGNILQEADNLYIHLGTEGDWKVEEDIEITVKHEFSGTTYTLLEISDFIIGDEVIVLEKDLDTGWLLGEYTVEAITKSNPSTLIRYSFDIMP